MSIAKRYRVKDLVNYPARAGKVSVDRSGRIRKRSHREASIRLLNLSESMLWKLVKRGDFLAPTYITASMPTWSDSQINEWLARKNRVA